MKFKYELHRILDGGLAEMNADQSKPAAEVFADSERQFGIEGEWIGRNDFSQKQLPKYSSDPVSITFPIYFLYF